MDAHRQRAAVLVLSTGATGKLGSAGLDVFVDEPHVPATLGELRNVVLTPHLGSATIETRDAMGDRVVRSLPQKLY